MPVDHVLTAPQEPVLARLDQLVSLRRQHLAQAGPCGRHCERVPVERTDLVDLALLDGLERLVGAPDRAGREPAAKRLCESDDVRRDSEPLGRAAGRDAEPGLDLIEDEQHSEPLGQLAHGLEVARLGKDHS